MVSDRDGLSLAEALSSVQYPGQRPKTAVLPQPGESPHEDEKKGKLEIHSVLYSTQEPSADSLAG